MNHIYVQDVNDPESIVGAFQEALNRVVTVENIDRLVEAEFVVHIDEFVYINDSTPPLGNISMFTDVPRESFAVFVTLNRYNSIPVPDAFTSRAFLQVGDTNLIARLSFDGQQFSTLINLPTMWLRAVPQISILLGE